MFQNKKNNEKKQTSLNTHNIKINNSKIITQKDIDDACAVLNECKRISENNGMPYPYFCPGVSPSNQLNYGDAWWSLDYALAAEGAMLYDERVGEELINNLLAVQKKDGRVPLYSDDNFDNRPFIKRPIGSLPKFFESVYMAINQNPSLKQKGFELISKNIEWWYKNRFDKNTGLFSAIFEETFIPNTVSDAYVYAPMDTNIELFIGCLELSKMADNEHIANEYKSRADAILQAIKKYCYNDEDGFFYPYIISQGKQYKVKMASGFLGYYLKDDYISSRLTRHLLNNDEFGWDSFPITSVSKCDSIFTITNGDYDANNSWQGSVWMLLNDSVIRALIFSGLKKEAKSLIEKTILAFRSNYAEFLNPFTGKGNGMLRYAWTAGLFLRLVNDFLIDNI